MTRNEFYSQIETTLGTEPGTIHTDTKLKDVPKWDSMAVILFQGMVDDELHTTIEGDDMLSATTFGDLANLVGDKLSD